MGVKRLGWIGCISSLEKKCPRHGPPTLAISATDLGRAGDALGAPSRTATSKHAGARTLLMLPTAHPAAAAAPAAAPPPFPPTQSWSNFDHFVLVTGEDAIQTAHLAEALQYRPRNSV